jgi:predicted ATPase/DNA-binding NarL/FixJ family response regulator
MARVATTPDSATNLPAEVSSFVGRRTDRAEVRRLLAESRLVTLTGFGGIGKTRLATHVATELRRAYPDGVWMVPLGDLSDPAELADVIAVGLGIRSQSRRPAVTTLVEHLAARELLLVLDNCEHLIDACAALVDGLLRACPRLRILVTSRSVLRISGESVLTLAPLSWPAQDVAASVPLHQFESVRLFLDRAQQVVPDFAVDDDNRAAILQICRHLEGIPLAIELAAVWLRAMSPQELLERLRDFWAMLAAGSRAAADRQRTMESSVRWSYDLCSPEERALWARLSVFSGGVELDAIEAVCGGDLGAAAGGPIAGLVLSLVDKSILSRTESNGCVRFRMLETLRRYGRGQLHAQGLLTDLRRRHQIWCLDLVRRAEAEWISPDQVRWMKRLLREQANLRAALEFSYSERGEAVTGLEICARSQNFALAYGMFRAGRLWLDRFLPRVDDASTIRLRGLQCACWLAVVQGDQAVAEAMLADARAITGAADDAAIAIVEQMAGVCAMFAGDQAAALDHFERAVAGFRGPQDADKRAITLVVTGMSHTFSGDIDSAMAPLDECLRMCEAAGECWFRSYALWAKGFASYLAGDPAQAAELVKKSMELHRQMDDHLGKGLCFEALACAVADDEPQHAAVLLGAADALWKMMDTSTRNLPPLFAMRRSCENALRDRLGAERFASAVAQGAGTPTADALTLALEDQPTKPARKPAVRRRSAATELTRREREIAALVASGLSNRDIASKLVISRRTAEAHVENILTKLGFSSRMEIAAWVNDAERADVV